MSLITRINKEIAQESDIFRKIQATLSSLMRLESKIRELERERYNYLRSGLRTNAVRIESQIDLHKRKRILLLRNLEKFAKEDEIIETDLAKEIAIIVQQQR